MIEQLLNKVKVISVVGLGYVGLPVAMEFANKFRVLGFDLDLKKIKNLKKSIDPTGEFKPEHFNGKDIEFTADPERLKSAHFHIIAVPTPVDKLNRPDLNALFKASSMVGKALKKGDYVIYESTVYPGCTQEDCLPILEAHSGLKLKEDFSLGYSPERINPGDKIWTLTKITKVVSANDSHSLDVVAQVYSSIIEAGVYKAKSIQVAEAAKVIENTQRDLNIALMNELSIIFDKLDIDTRSVLKAAETKWNFLKFYPGLVGGHCIGVDPYYLTYKAEKIGYSPKVILSGRQINDGMPAYVAKKLVQTLVQNNKVLTKSRVVIFGVSFKENVKDTRNSKAAVLAKELKEFAIDVEIWDPIVNTYDVQQEYDLSCSVTISGKYDAVVIAVAHDQFKQNPLSYYKDIMNEPSILFDLKGIFEDELDEDLIYWRL